MPVDACISVQLGGDRCSLARCRDLVAVGCQDAGELGQGDVQDTAEVGVRGEQGLVSVTIGEDGAHVDGTGVVSRGVVRTVHRFLPDLPRPASCERDGADPVLRLHVGNLPRGAESAVDVPVDVVCRHEAVLARGSRSQPRNQMPGERAGHTRLPGI